MSDTIQATLPLRRWQGDRGTYHLVTLTGAEAEAITTHAALHRMEYGKQRGFGSVKVIARVGDTEWKSSVFPMNVPADDDQATRSLHPSTRSLPENVPGGRVEGAGGAAKSNKEWTLLVSKKVMRAENLTEGDPVELELELL